MTVRTLDPEYPYVPLRCRTGRCQHPGDRHDYYRTPRCLSGECHCANRGLACGIVTEEAPRG